MSITSPTANSLSDLHHLSLTERQAIGKDLRKQVPRSDQAEWHPPAHRPDSLALLKASNQGRLPHLLPLRYGRMQQSPLAFLRGAAVIMATDLMNTPTTGTRVQVCGDCHLMNFGVFATPERNLIFDLNDFDETLPAPWEWDVKRLATSFVVAGRYLRLSSKQCEAAARSVAQSYRQHLAEYAEMAVLDIWYSRLDARTVSHLMSDTAEKPGQTPAVPPAHAASAHALPKLTEVVNGQRRIIDRPPLITHVDRADGFEDNFRDFFQRYQMSLQDAQRVLLDRYQLVDVAMKVVGVGSVGTRCAIALLMASDDDALLLQFKEAYPSVLEPCAGKSAYAHQGQRVVIGQRLVQAASDIFLGWATGEQGNQFYFRQLRDAKASININKLSAKELTSYAEFCGWVLARAHARTGDPVIISSYLGQKDVFDQAIAQFAEAYADQNERDHARLVEAANAGEIETQPG